MSEQNKNAAPLLQAGMNNDELRAAWQSKLPRIAPSDEQLSAFALGAEIGWSRAVAFVRAEAARRWSQRESAPQHWKAYPSWESMARAVEWLAEDMEGGKQREAFEAGRVQEGAAPSDTQKLGMFEHRCPNVTGHRGGVFVCQRASHGVSQDSYCAKCDCPSAPSGAVQEGGGEEPIPEHDWQAEAIKRREQLWAIGKALNPDAKSMFWDDIATSAVRVIEKYLAPPPAPIVSAPVGEAVAEVTVWERTALGTVRSAVSFRNGIDLAPGTKLYAVPPGVARDAEPFDSKTLDGLRKAGQWLIDNANMTSGSFDEPPQPASAFDDEIGRTGSWLISLAERAERVAAIRASSPTSGRDE